MGNLKKEELLKKISSLNEIVISPDLMESMIEQKDNRDDDSNDLLNESKKYSSDIIFDYIRTRDNVTEVRKPNIGILPYDLENPLQFGGNNWDVEMLKQGSFVYHMWKFTIKTQDKDALFSKIDNIINENKWIHTYVYSIDDMYQISLCTANGIEPITIVRMCGVTEEDIRNIKNVAG